MKTTSNIVGWVCIFSTLFMGCYTSFLTEPTSTEKQKPEPMKVKTVVTKDGTVYRFDPLAVADSTAIVGVVNGKQVSIPLSDVESVTTSSGRTSVIHGLFVFGAILAVPFLVGIIWGFRINAP